LDAVSPDGFEDGFVEEELTIIHKTVKRIV
jgi:hypothetical protein